MKRNYILDGKKIIERFKKSLKIKTDKELTRILGVRPSTISTWKKRNTLNYALLIELCELHKIDLNYLFHGIPFSHPSRKDQGFHTPLVSRPVLHEYIMGGFENKISELPAYIFPFVKNEHYRAFQAISGNMWPLVGENSLVVCELAQPKEIREKEVFVFISRKKGFFLNRIKKIDEEHLLLTNDHPNYRKDDLRLEKNLIDEVWSVIGVFNTNTQKRTWNGAEHAYRREANEEIKNILIERERELVAHSLKMRHIKNEIENILKDVGVKNLNGTALKLKTLFGKEGTWDCFIKKFVGIHPGFREKLKTHYPQFSKSDIDFCSLILLGLSNKEIGSLLNISHQSVITKKYRLRKKMSFSSQENSLYEYLHGFK